MIYTAWILVFALMVWFFGILETNKRNPNQHVQTQVNEGGSKGVILQSSRYGHYVVTGKINSKKVTFLIGMGVSYVSVPRNVANKIGFEKGAPLMVLTAYGDVTVYATTLDSVSVGDTTLHNIKAEGRLINDSTMNLTVTE